jgi:hypothetical protein
VTYGWSMFMKVRNAAASSQQFMGCRRIQYDWSSEMALNNTGGFQAIGSFDDGYSNPLVLTGTMTLAGSSYYVNGTARNTGLVANPGAHCGIADLYILTSNWAGQPHGGSSQTEVQGVAVYSDTLTAGQAAAIATAVGGW